MTVDPKKGNELLAKLLKTKTLPIVLDPKPEIPPGLASDPIAQQLQKQGSRVTRANWLTLDRGSPSEENLDGETQGFLDLHFPRTKEK
jgi:hypothetical protein